MSLLASFTCVARATRKNFLDCLFEHAEEFSCQNISLHACCENMLKSFYVGTSLFMHVLHMTCFQAESTLSGGSSDQAGPPAPLAPLHPSHRPAQHLRRSRHQRLVDDPAPPQDPGPRSSVTILRASSIEGPAAGSSNRIAFGPDRTDLDL